MGITIIASIDEQYVNALFNTLHQGITALSENTKVESKYLHLTDIATQIDGLHHDFMNVIQDK